MRYPSGMRRSPSKLGLALLGLALALAAGCSHTFYQFDVSSNELAWIQSTQQSLAASSGNPAALAQVVDLPGRRAVETLIAGMTVQSTEGDRQYEQLTHALYLGVMADNEDPIQALDSDATLMAARVGQRVAAHGLSQMGLGGIAQLVGGFGDHDGQRLNEMSQSLARGNIGGCVQGEVIVSYDAGILGHIHTELADQDANYVAWRQRVRSIHLVRFACQRGQVLVVMTRNDGERGLKVIGWHFLSPEAWQQTEPRLREAFDLPQ